VVNVVPFLAAPSASGQVICTGTAATLKASAPFGTFQWYDAPSGGNLLSSNTVFTTPPLTNDTNYYYVQDTYEGCVSGRTTVRVIVLQLPQPPVVAGATICSGSNATLTVSGAAGSYQWYDSATGGTLLATSPNFYTPPLTTNTTYYVQNVSNNCASTRTPVTVNVLPAPAPVIVKGDSICQYNSATLTASTANGTLQWYDAPANGNLLATGNTYTTPVLSKDTAFYVQNTLGQCARARVAVPVTIIKLFNVGFQYTEGTYCTSDTTPPKPYIFNPGPGAAFSASPAGLVIDPATGQIIPSESKPGLYSVTLVSSGTCPYTSHAFVNIVTSPDPAFTYNGPFCQGAADPLPVFTPKSSAGVFMVSKNSPAGLVIANSSTGEINLTASLPGTYLVTNTIVSSKYFQGCPLVSDSARVVILPAPTLSAGPDQTEPAGVPVQLTGSFTGASGVKWSGGSGAFSDPTSPTAIYTPAAGETTIKLTLTAINPTAQCVPPSPSSMTITIVPAPASTTVCAGSAATLIATAPGGSYGWYSAATGGNLLSSSPSFTTPPLFTTTSYYEQTTVNGIAGPLVQVTVTVNDLPGTPTAPSDTICSGNSTTLTASGSTGTVQWYDAKTGGNIIYIGNSYTTPVLFANTAYYIDATSAGGCASPRTEVDVTVKPTVAITSAATGVTCSGIPYSYTITSNINSTYSWSRAAVAGISNQAVADSVTTGLIGETLTNTGNTPVSVTYVITPLLANSCTGAPFNLTVMVYPPILVTSPDTASICNGTNVNYTLQLSSQPQYLSWSRAQVNGISNPPLNNQFGPNIQETLTNTTNSPLNVHYIFSFGIEGCNAYTFDLAVTVNPTPSVTSDTVGYACSGIPENYIITSNVDSATFTWSRAAVTGISNAAVANQASGIINEALVNTSNAPVVVTYEITPYIHGCQGVSFYYFVLVNISLTTITNSNSPVCLDSTIQLNTIGNIPGASYLWSGPNGFTSSQQNPSISNASKANEGTYTLTVYNNGCASPVDSVQVLVNNPPVANAGPNQLVCVASTAVNLNGIISGGTTTGVWSTSGTGTFSPASNQLKCQYIISAQDRSLPGVTLTLTSTSPDNCTNATSAMKVTFQPLPTADAGGNLEICSQDTAVKINGQVNYADSLLWTSSGTGTFSPSANVSAPFYIPGASDVQNRSVSITLQAYSVLCGSVSNEMSIKFIPPPIVNTGKQLKVIKGRPTQLFPSVSENNVQYLWSPDININNDTIKNPTITATKETTYTLKVTDIRGCVAEDSIIVKVLDGLEIPNTFTPNGDGVNDTWVIPDLDTYPGATVDIFTRYGQKVFHSNGYGVPWDGTNNGKPLPQGVYYYIIKTNYTEKPLSGTITIIR
jgi:gliding motility-associated-like protein